MATRERIRRIGSVRRLRELREKADGRAVSEARAAVNASERRLAALEEDCRRLQAGIDKSLVEGIRSPEIADYHLLWRTRREQRIAAASAARESRERLREAIDAYLRSRIERRRIEAWETAAVDSLRREEEHAEAVASDEITVIRYGRREGA